MNVIERLRKFTVKDQHGNNVPPNVTQEAADEIERLRTALQDIADCITHDYSRRDIQAITLAALEDSGER